MGIIETVFKIVFTVVVVVILASICGWFIRRFNITTTQLGILWIIGFGIIFIRAIGANIPTAIVAIGIIILIFASGGFLYKYLMED